MWIRDVDFPAELLSEFRAGDLVFFVGAGASADEPSGLPLFGSLTKQVAEAAHQDFDPKDLAQPDVLLGRFQDRGVDVHQIIKTIIGSPASQPNETHRAIARLAAAGGPVRIVTTNYDLHLSSALRDLGVPVTEYRGPAVPMGDDIEGVVYLHGDLTQEPRHLIATEGDLGRAYLTDAWAARFVERMFAKYTVLFIGYSHNDTVMRLIARGIGHSGRTRYALTDQADSEIWTTYRVTPIRYDVVDKSHAALAEALNGWATLLSTGLHGHRQWIARLVGSPPPLVPEHISYLEDVLGDPDRVRFFTELAEAEEWLPWVAQRAPFPAMFDPGAPTDQCVVLLAEWFVNRFVMDADRSAAALAVWYQAGGRPAPVLCDALGGNLNAHPTPRPAWLGPWVALLAQHTGAEQTFWLELVLLGSEAHQDRATALLLFDTLTEPRLRQRAWYTGTPQSFEVALKGDVHRLDEAWDKILRPVLDDVAAETLAIADRQLRRVTGLMTVAGSATPGWDPVSFGRFRVESDAEDRFREPVDVLIDVARDSIEVILAAGGPAGPGYLNAWAASGVPILQRLALHGWTRRTDVDATAKLAWLRTTGWLYEHRLRPELFQLIRDALPESSAAEAEALVNDARTLPVDGDDPRVAYQRFNALTWFVRSAPALSSARAALDEIHAAHPHFKARENPDLIRSRIEVGIVPDRPPMTVEELHARISADPAGAVADLRRYESVRSPFDGPGWSDVLALLAATVQVHPEDGFTILTPADPAPEEMISGIIKGWSAATLEPVVAVDVIQRLRHLNLEAHAEAISQLLLSGAATPTSTTKWHLLPAARELAEELWAVLGPVEPPDRDDPGDQPPGRTDRRVLAPRRLRRLDRRGRRVEWTDRRAPEAPGTHARPHGRAGLARAARARRSPGLLPRRRPALVRGIHAAPDVLVRRRGPGGPRLERLPHDRSYR
jgi:hypothetical protein